jgi:osmotically-inducible protein OsmY
MLQRIAGLVSAAGLVLAVACSQTDPGITTKVKARFVNDDIVKAYQINVDTKNGVVTLTGDVETTAAKEQAIKLARGTEGVRDVVDRMRVNEAAATSGLLNREAGTAESLPPPQTGEKTQPGIVERTEDAARNVGEKTADATRNAREKTADAARNAGEKTADAARRTGAVVTDAAITTAVKTKFLADTAVKGLSIDVDTKDGVVTLTGNVTSKAEANRALMLARNTEGVKRVVNNLKIGA